MSGPLERERGKKSKFEYMLYMYIAWHENSIVLSDSPRITTRTDITKQNTSLMASAIKFTDAGRKSYLFSVDKKKS